jgi:hypothetical protein
MRKLAKLEEPLEEVDETQTEKECAPELDDGEFNDSSGDRESLNQLGKLNYWVKQVE